MKLSASALLVLPALLVAAFPAHAATDAGCEALAWPVETELEWMNADAKIVPSGATLEAPPEAAMSVVLDPPAKMKQVAEPSGRPKQVSVENYGGIVKFEGVTEAGLYQVSLGRIGWVDIVQDGKTLPSVDDTIAEDCKGIHKSVRFEIGPGPFTLQLSSVPRSAVKVTLRPAE